MRYFFEVAYNGTNYHGWQIQKNSQSIQEVLTDHLSTKLRTEVEIVGSGRTDAGVHARKQIFHVDIQKPVDPIDFKLEMNGFLPHDIAIRKIQKVKSNAHARFDALQRSYEYRIVTEKDPFHNLFVYNFYENLSLQRMEEGSKYLLGIQDFESFSKVKTDVTNFQCEIFTTHWKLDGNNFTFFITANRFLRGMVRAIVGSLLDVGTGKIQPSHMEKILKARDRKRAGHSVPAKGLSLTDVVYPDQIFRE